MASSATSKQTLGAALSLRVTGGLHEGADVDLAPDAMLVVGCDEASDVRLMDEGVQPRHFALLTHDGTLELRAFADPLDLNGRAVGRAPVTLTVPATLAIGEHCALLIDERDAPPREPRPASVLLQATRVVAGIVATVGLVLLARALAPKLPVVASAAERRAVIVQQLEAVAEGADLSVITSGDRFVISGVVADEVREQVETAIAPHAAETIVNLVTQSELVEQVVAVFAGNGYDATAVYMGDASVRITNLDGANPAVTRVAEHARRDVAGLRTLSVLPAAVSNEAPTWTLSELGGRARLSRIVDGDTAYLASTDGARYFVGSVLPGGHRVRRITKDAVQLDHDGRLGWVRF